MRDRIEEIRKATPPPKGRKARNPYASKDDFADLLGVSRSRVIAWTHPDNPAYPDAKGREALARLSHGRYQPSDFAPPTQPERGSLARRVSAIEAAVATIERHIFGEDAAPS